MLSLEGPRIRLRDFAPADMEGLVALAEDDSMWSYTKFRLDRSAVADTLDYLVNEPFEQNRQNFTLAVEVGPRGLAGICHLGELTPGGGTDIGWYLGSAHWGHGYAFEATGLLLRFAFHDLGLNEVTAIAHPDNAASIRVLERSGLRQVGAIENVDTWQGPQPRMAFALSRAAYEQNLAELAPPPRIAQRRR